MAAPPLSFNGDRVLVGFFYVLPIELNLSCLLVSLTGKLYHFLQ